MEKNVKGLKWVRMMKVSKMVKALRNAKPTKDFSFENWIAYNELIYKLEVDYKKLVGNKKAKIV